MDREQLREVLDRCPVDLKRTLKQYVKSPSAIKHAYALGYVDALGQNELISCIDYAYMLQLIDQISLNQEKLEIVKQELES